MHHEKRDPQVTAKISIIVPVKNGENYLREAILSGLAQDYENIEMIVVNDGSTDKTSEIIESFGTRIKTLHQENQGVGASRNRGVEMSQGEYLAFLDHDDLWEPSKLRKQKKLWEEAGSDPLVFCQMQQFFCPTLNEEERKKIILNQAALSGYIPGGLFISKRRFLQIGFFTETRDLGDFMEWYAKALSLNAPHTLLNAVGLYRRIHQNNMGRHKEAHPRAGYLRTLKHCLDRGSAHAVRRELLADASR